jgi:hypothetical protein
MVREGGEEPPFDASERRGILLSSMPSQIVLSSWSLGWCFMAEPNARSIFEPDEAEDARLDGEAMAAYRAGRFVPHAKVAEWLDSWGTPNELPCPKPESR